MAEQKRDLDVVVRLMRRGSAIVSDGANRLGLKPNHITVFRLVVLGGVACGLLATGSYWLHVVALVLLMLNFFFDLVDGDLARRHNLRSPLGAALEENLDSILLNALILALVIGMSLRGEPYAVVGYVCLFSQVFSRHYTDLYKERFGVDCVESHADVEAVRGSSDWLTHAVAELLAPKGQLFSLFSNFRYFLIVGVVVNQIGPALALYTAFISLRWIGLMAFTISYYGAHPALSKYKIYPVLAKLEHKKLQV